MESHDDDVMAQLASQYYSMSRNRSASAPIRPGAVNTSTWQYSEDTNNINISSQLPIPPPPDVDLVTSLMADSDLIESPLKAQNLQSSQSLHENLQRMQDLRNLSSDTRQNDTYETLLQNQLPATLLRTTCDQLEFYFCDDNLLGDLFLLKNMNMDGYVKLDLLASFNRVKRLTTDMSQLRHALELSTKLLMNEDQTLVCRKIPLAPEHTYHGKLARTAIAYNLPADACVANLRDKFQECGTISYLRLLKQNSNTGRNAVLKPPIAAGETYAIVEYEDEQMSKHAVLTLSDQYNWRTGMQVVLFDGTNCDKLKQKLFPVDADRRRARSSSAVTRLVHVDAVGEGLDSLQEGRVSTGTVFSIRGAGGLIHPTRLENAAISFRLIPDEDGNMDIRAGDYVSFTVGKNKKSGRKYASKVKLEFRSPTQSGSDKSPSRWDMRSRSSTIGTVPSSPNAFRSRSSSNGARPRLALVSGLSQGDGTLGSLGYKQALGPDGTRGFGARRSGTYTPEMNVTGKFMTMERRRSQSSAPAPQF